MPKLDAARTQLNSFGVSQEEKLECGGLKELNVWVSETGVLAQR